MQSKQKDNHIMSLASHDAYMYALMHTAINGIPVNIMPVLTSIEWALDRSIKTSYKYNQILEKKQDYQYFKV